MRTMRLGVRPDGTHYFPSFPYPSFTKIVDQDLRDLWAYLRSVPPSSRANQPHDLRFPFGWRRLVWGWKLLFFSPGAFVPDHAGNATLNRGAYLVNALGHCGECHTPRTMTMATDNSRFLAGNPKGPEDSEVPNITPDKDTGLTWTGDQIAEYLATGNKPDGDVAGSLMSEVIHGTTAGYKDMTKADLLAIAHYLKSVPPVKHRVERKQ